LTGSGQSFCTLPRAAFLSDDSFRPEEYAFEPVVAILMSSLAGSLHPSSRIGQQ
jgi:hypothetical protein